MLSPKGLNNLKSGTHNSDHHVGTLFLQFSTLRNYRIIRLQNVTYLQQYCGRAEHRFKIP